MRMHKSITLAGMAVLLLSFAGIFVTAHAQSSKSKPAPAKKAALTPQSAAGCEIYEIDNDTDSAEDQAVTMGEACEPLEADMDVQDGNNFGASIAPGALAHVAASQEANNVWLMGDDSGWLGVEIAEISSDTAKEKKLPEVRGVLVQNVEADSPAAKSGLKENDVVMTFDGQNVEGTVQFRRLVRETPAGRTIALGIIRDGASQTISVEIGDRDARAKNQKVRNYFNYEMPDLRELTVPNFNFHMLSPDETSDWRQPALGIHAEDLSGQFGSYFGAPDGEGVLVREVRPGTPAEKAGLKAGDVITKVNGKAVKDLRELRAQIRENRDQKSVNLAILRKGSEMSLPVAIEKPRPLESSHTIHRAQI